MKVEWYVPSLGTPIVAFAEYGLSLNPAAFIAMNEPTGVRLGFDRVRRWIVMLPIDGDEDDIKRQEGLPIRGRDGSYRVNARDFTRFVYRYYPELRPGGRSVRYLAWVMENEGVLIVDLTQPVDSRAGTGEMELTEQDALPRWDGAVLDAVDRAGEH